MSNLEATPIQLVYLSTTCGCVDSSTEAQTISAGESIEVEVILSSDLGELTSNKAVPVAQNLYLHLSRQDHSFRITLPVRANIQAPFGVEPLQLTMPRAVAKGTDWPAVTVQRFGMSNEDFQSIGLSGSTYYNVERLEASAQRKAFRVSANESIASSALTPLSLTYKTGTKAHSLPIPVEWEPRLVTCEPDKYDLLIDYPKGVEASKELRSVSLRSIRVQSTLGAAVRIKQIRWSDRNDEGILSWRISDSAGIATVDLWLNNPPKLNSLYGQLSVEYELLPEGKKGTIGIPVRVRAAASSIVSAD